MTEEKKQEFAQRIGKANKTELVAIVYEIAIAYTEDAQTALKADDIAAFKEGLDGIKKCVDDLANTLNFDIDFSNQLLSIYNYIRRQLTAVRMDKNPETLEHIKWMLTEIGGSFTQIADQDNSGSVMEATEHVVAGMTYGRGVLNENVVNSEAGHSFSV